MKRGVQIITFLIICKNRPMVQCHWSPLKLDLDPISLSRESLFQGTISLAKHRRNNINGWHRIPAGGVLPYKGLMGTCDQPGYVFRDFCLKQGIDFIIFCLNQGIDLSIFVLNRINVLNRVLKIGILS